MRLEMGKTHAWRIGILKSAVFYRRAYRFGSWRKIDLFIGSICYQSSNCRKLWEPDLWFNCKYPHKSTRLSIIIRFVQRNTAMIRRYTYTYILFYFDCSEIPPSIGQEVICFVLTWTSFLYGKSHGGLGPLGWPSESFIHTGWLLAAAMAACHPMQASSKVHRKIGDKTLEIWIDPRLVNPITDVKCINLDGRLESTPCDFVDDPHRDSWVYATRMTSIVAG